MSQVVKKLPTESILYLGDTARVPYGNKSSETVLRYARECAGFLVDRGVKAIVIACNTATAYALTELSRELPVPVIGVIEPGARAAMLASKKKVVGVIGTRGTIESNAYGKALKAIDPKVRVVSSACPLFVPLVEEGFIDDDITRAVAKRYLGGLCNEGIDALILGCTHYPLLKNTIKSVVGDGVAIVDSAETTAQALSDLLDKNAARSTSAPEHGIYFTDLPQSFERVTRLFLGFEARSIKRVDL